MAKGFFVSLISPQRISEVSIKTMFIITFLLTTTSVVVTNGQFSANTTIRCMNLSDCPVLYDVIKNGTVSDDKVTLLQTSQCGFGKKEPKVWCPIPYGQCVTPEGINSTCRTIIDCPHFFNATRYLAFEDFSKLFPRYQCKGEDDILKICCPDYNIITTTTSATRTSTTPMTTISTSSTEPVVEETTIPSNSLIDKTLTRINVISGSMLLPDPLKGECGKQDFENRIVGGNIADINEFPWMVILKHVNKLGQVRPICGGTLINERYVLTAAHCLERKRVENLLVVAGEYNTTTDPDCVADFRDKFCAPPAQLFNVTKVVQHRNWMRAEPQFYDDIALLRLSDKVAFSEFAQPICLPSAEVDLNKTNEFIIAGWGKTDNGVLSDVKRKGDVTLVNADLCKDVYRKEVNGQLCVASFGSADACSGDSGGPLMYRTFANRNVIWYQAAITSLGYNSPCGRFPALYTYVPRYLRWIYDVIEP